VDDGHDGHDKYGEQDGYDDLTGPNHKETKAHRRSRMSLQKSPTIQAFATPVIATLTTINAYNKVDSD
jgi:hypothetical protein